MGGKRLIKVQEECAYLRSRIKQERVGKNVIRLQSLLYIKEERFSKQAELAAHLGYHVRTMELWLKAYKEGGLEAMLIDPDKKQTRKRKISPEVHEGLSKRLHDPEGGFASYVEAVNWVESEYRQSYNYTTLRQYMIDKFGTKPKQPRKQHVERDAQAQALFLKVASDPYQS